MTDAVKVGCPACSQVYNVRVDKLGREIACRKCGATFTLTAAAASAKIGAGATKSQTGATRRQQEVERREAASTQRITAPAYSRETMSNARDRASATVGVLHGRLRERLGHRGATIALAGAGVLVVLVLFAGLRGLFGGGAGTTSRDYTAAEAAEIIRLLESDPDLRAEYLNPGGVGSMIPEPLWVGLLGEPHGVVPDLGLWTYVCNDGQITVTVRGPLDEQEIPWVVVMSIDGTVSLSGKSVDRDRLKSIALRVKKRVDRELESSGALARLEEEFREYEQEMMAAKAAGHENRKREARESALVHAEGDFAVLRLAIPRGPERDAFEAQREEWIRRRGETVGQQHVAEIERGDQFTSNVPLPTEDSVMEALRNGASVPVVSPQ